MSPSFKKSEKEFPKEPSSSSSSRSRDAVKIIESHDFPKEVTSSSGSPSIGRLDATVENTCSFSADNSNKRFQDVDIEQILVVEVSQERDV